MTEKRELFTKDEYGKLKDLFSEGNMYTMGPNFPFYTMRVDGPDLSPEELDEQNAKAEKNFFDNLRKIIFALRFFGEVSIEKWEDEVLITYTTPMFTYGVAEKIKKILNKNTLELKKVKEILI